MISILNYLGRTHRHTRGVGTHSYAAPEQLNSQESDVKVYITF